MEELFWRMHFVDALPAAAGIWLEESWEADVVEHGVDLVLDLLGSAEYVRVVLVHLPHAQQAV